MKFSLLELNEAQTTGVGGKKKMKQYRDKTLFIVFTNKTVEFYVDHIFKIRHSKSFLVCRTQVGTSWHIYLTVAI